MKRDKSSSKSWQERTSGGQTTNRVKASNQIRYKQTNTINKTSIAICMKGTPESIDSMSTIYRPQAWKTVGHCCRSRYSKTGGKRKADQTRECNSINETKLELWSESGQKKWTLCIRRNGLCDKYMYVMVKQVMVRDQMRWEEQHQIMLMEDKLTDCPLLK